MVCTCRGMTRKEEIESAFSWFKTDKLGHGYAMIYDKVPRYIRTIFEIGIATGASLRAWLELFPNAHIYGLDSGDHAVKHPRITNYTHTQIKNFDPEWDGDSIDLVIDDGSHAREDILAGWNILKSYCR